MFRFGALYLETLLKMNLISLMDLMVNYNFIAVVSWSFPLSIIDHAHDNVAPLLPKKAKTILIQKESSAKRMRWYRLLVLLWSGHGIIPKFTVSFSYLKRKSPWFPSCHLIQNASSSFHHLFSKQKGEENDDFYTTVLLSLVVVVRWCFAHKIHTALLLFFRSNLFEPKVHSSCLSDDY